MPYWMGMDIITLIEPLRGILSSTYLPRLEGLITSIAVTLFVIFFSFVYYLMVSSFLMDVALRRLVKASFDDSWKDVSDLIISYFLGMLVYMYIIYFYGTYINMSLIPVNNPTKNITFIIPFGLGLLYTGRIITRNAGVFYGKLHFSAIFLSAAFAIGLEFTNVLSGGPMYSSNLIDHGILLHMHNYISLVSNKFVAWSFIGTLILSTFGEEFLSNRSPCEKSLLVVSDKFPSDFKVLTGNRKDKKDVGVINKKSKLCNQKIEAIDECFEDNLDCSITDVRIKNMLSENDLVKVRCATKSLKLAEYIKQSDINKDANRKVCCKILRSPPEAIIDDRLNKETNIYSPRFVYKMLKGELNSEKKEIENLVKNEYSKDYWNTWLPLLKSKRIIGKQYYFGDLRFILTENKLGQKKILLLIRDMSPRRKRVGLYSSEPYIADHFASLFDNAWDLAT